MKEPNNLDFVEIGLIYKTKYKTSNKYSNYIQKRYCLAISKTRRINFIKQLTKLLDKYSK